MAKRAQEAVDLHNEELEAREAARYRAAITARKALALEAASHGRLIMSARLPRAMQSPRSSPSWSCQSATRATPTRTTRATPTRTGTTAES